MAWTFDVNNTYSSHSASLFKLKTVMVTAGWAVKASGDGLSAFSSTGDVITSGGSGAGGFGNGRAWIRIQSPSISGAQREFTMQWIAANQVRVKYSSSAKFTGGTQNSTTTPTATDEAVHTGGGTDSAPTGTALLANDGASARLECMAGDASQGYSFFMITFPTGGGTTAKYVFGYEWMDPSMTRPQEPDPFVLWNIQNIQLQLGRLGSSALTNYGGQLKAWSRLGQVDASFVAMQTMRPMRYDLGLEMANGNTPVSPINNGDETWPIMVGRHQITVAPNIGIKGVMHNLRMQGAARVTGDTLTVVSTSDRLILDDMVFPWNGTTPTV